MRIKIVTDSTADLPPEVCRALDITVIPLNVHFGETIYQDGLDLPAEEFYKKLESSPIFPQTSTKPPETFARTYRRLSQEADAIVSIHISASFSGTLNAARLGSLEAGVPVELIDSQSVSMGLALLAILAARMARDGASGFPLPSRTPHSRPILLGSDRRGLFLLPSDRCPRCHRLVSVFRSPELGAGGCSSSLLRHGRSFLLRFSAAGLAMMPATTLAGLELDEVVSQ